jgi:hypothetical protein
MSIGDIDEEEEPESMGWMLVERRLDVAVFETDCGMGRGAVILKPKKYTL